MPDPRLSVLRLCDVITVTSAAAMLHITERQLARVLIRDPDAPRPVYVARTRFFARSEIAAYAELRAHRAAERRQPPAPRPRPAPAPARKTAPPPKRKAAKKAQRTEGQRKRAA